ncbi:hypothetical protein [Phenylobacterium sp.]|jgi:hypothetical protein|uniref:hypothetical protein n=1 Tax=Phenylobacterium sp. TaxID=1871053 RepID=UPI0037C66394
MTGAAPSNTEMLAGLTECAYRLGMAFGAEAERTGGQARIDAFNLYDRCFFSVRVAIGLQLRLRREDRASGREHAEATEREADDSRERSDYLAPERDRERDRETEPASLPVLLKTLNSVVVDAQALPGPPPAALPALTEILVGIGAAPGPAAARRPRGDLRTRLTASTTAPAQAPGLRAAPQSRQATGPPRR